MNDWQCLWKAKHSFYFVIEDICMCFKESNCVERVRFTCNSKYKTEIELEIYKIDDFTKTYYLQDHFFHGFCKTPADKTQNNHTQSGNHCIPNHYLNNIHY